MDFIKKYTFLFLALLSLTACQNALQEDPETFYNEEQVFATEEGVEAAVNGLFSAFFDGGYYGSSWHGMIMPLSGKFWSNQTASQDATSLNTASNNTWLLRLWPQMYTTINTANVIIANLEKSEAGLANQETALGQAYFIRSLVYFDLVRLFGGVPLRTTPTTFDDLHLARATKGEVYELVIADLQRAMDLLPAPGTYRLERPTPFTAQAYLAKVYLTLASEGNDANYYNLAKTAALEVIQNGPYQLTPTYAELFDFGNENTVESIMEIQYGQTGGVRNADIVRMYTPRNSIYVANNVVTFGRIRPNKETFDQHVNQYPGDPRIDATFIYDSYALNNGNTQTIYPTRTTGNDGYACIRKYLDPTYNGTTTSRNMILFRYADLLLMMAEIENELSGPDAAYDYVNQVLARARDLDGDGMSDTVEPADWSGMSQETFRFRIRQERLYELLAEGQDWFDTRRFGYDYFLETVVRPHNEHPTFDSNRDFVYPEDEKNMLLPIPLTEISGNQLVNPEDQNPGY
ncbi:RagB/SusD family nutrient uptake outer membrane protein [Lewinella sp. LCG006]|uniref:RagB/SusD family nutrient uptake outer membrane protein n=1 Tax=Lewinella sp. LCG006 TaxID=3231911 RepID=UPI0034614698